MDALQPLCFHYLESHQHAQVTGVRKLCIGLQFIRELVVKMDNLPEIGKLDKSPDCLPMALLL